MLCNKVLKTHDRNVGVADQGMPVSTQSTRHKTTNKKLFIRFFLKNLENILSGIIETN